MGVTPAEAVRFMGKLLKERMPESERRARKLREALPSVVQMLVEEFDVRRVVLFGSIVRGVVDERSDVDLAVEGLDPGSYFAALSRAEEVAGATVDLVPIEEVPSSLLTIIESSGEVLIDRR